MMMLSTKHAWFASYASVVAKLGRLMLATALVTRKRDTVEPAWHAATAFLQKADCASTWRGLQRAWSMWSAVSSSNLPMAKMATFRRLLLGAQGHREASFRPVLGRRSSVWSNHSETVRGRTNLRSGELRRASWSPTRTFLIFLTVGAARTVSLGPLRWLPELWRDVAALSENSTADGSQL